MKGGLLTARISSSSYTTCAKQRRVYVQAISALHCALLDCLLAEVAAPLLAAASNHQQQHSGRPTPRTWGSLDRAFAGLGLCSCAWQLKPQFT